MKQEVLRMERVTRIEHGITKLEDFQLRIYKGEIMGLIPINAHGMNTFLELLQTNLPIDKGYIYYGNELVNSWKESRKNHNRISIIKAQSSLVEGLTVLDNIFVLRQGFKQRVIRKSILQKQLIPFLNDIKMDISADSYVEKLSVFERVVVEILRAVMLGHQLIVLNEISTLISEQELFKLHDIIRKYAAQGYSFLNISPHLEEIIMICDRAALLSYGRIPKIIQGAEMTRESLSGYTQEYERMIREHLEKASRSPKKQQAVFNMKNVTYGTVWGINLDVYAGECLVIQNMDHEVFHDMISLLTGENVPESGDIYITGENVSMQKNTDVSVIQEYPTTSMIFQEMDYMNNLCIGLAQRMPNVWRRRNLRESIIQEYGSVLGEEVFYLHMDQLTQKQKYQLIYTRILLQRPKVVFCIHPFKGTDLPHRMFVWEQLEMLMDKGIAVVIFTMNMSDSISIAERLIRIGRGGFIEEITRDNFGVLKADVPWQYLYQDS